jgi:hypothetical protein
MIAGGNSHGSVIFIITPILLLHFLLYKSAITGVRYTEDRQKDAEIDANKEIDIGFMW